MASHTGMTVWDACRQLQAVRGSMGQRQGMTCPDGTTYDAMGNRTEITKERRGLPEESGVYRYIYDGLQRLTGVEKDGKMLRSYRYAAFGNRTAQTDLLIGLRLRMSSVADIQYPGR